MPAHCPISSDFTGEYRARLNALWVVALASTWLATAEPWFGVILISDFLLRDVLNKPRYSLSMRLSDALLSLFAVKDIRINAAPKRFAGILGFSMSSIVMVLLLFGNGWMWQVVLGNLMAFAALEAGVNFCLGCKLYGWFVRPKAIISPPFDESLAETAQPD